MLGIRIGQVKEISHETESTQSLIVDIEGRFFKALNYSNLTGIVHIADQVLLNTTAVDLSLGTGGQHFVIANLNNPTRELTGEGHIMKLRYSPFQVKVLAAEEQDSEYHETFNRFVSLEGMPIIVGTLHSMLQPIIEIIKAFDPGKKITYIMTDGAALPMALSNVVRKLKNQGRIQGSITIGHAFGGDLECVNIYNGLIAAKEILNSDLAVVAMGPGIVGTGTKYGFTGIEQGHIIDAVNTLGGTAIAVPRISFADKRQRHYGISHHSLTVLTEISKTRSSIGIPKFLDKQKSEIIKKQIETSQLHLKHNIIDIEEPQIREIIHILDYSQENMSTMGRTYYEDKEFFITVGAAGLVATTLLNDHQ